VVELLRDLVRTPSISGSEDAVVQVWAGWAERLGFVPVVDGRNVWIERRVSDAPALLFNSHLDTVKAGPTWTRDPWDGAIEEGRVHGLGANDAKASVAAQLIAAAELAESGFDGNLIVCASCDEETGGAGMERVARLLPHYDAAVIGEPNNFAVATGQRGLVKVYIDVPGQRAHASRPWQGRNAIHAAARVIAAIEAPHLNVPGDLRKATAQVTVIEGGTQSNVIPDACRLTIDSRTTPEFNNDAMLAHLEAAAALADAKITVVSRRFAPCETPRDADIVRAVLDATGASEATVFPSVCDLFWVAHVPSLVCGPGRPERSHQADEFVLASELIDGAAKYADIARRYHALARAGA
jgi:acetylornithine deacetylase